MRFVFSYHHKATWTIGARSKRWTSVAKTNGSCMPTYIDRVRVRVRPRFRLRLRVGVGVMIRVMVSASVSLSACVGLRSSGLSVDTNRDRHNGERG